MTTINDQTHTLFAVAIGILGVTTGFATNRLDQRWTPVAYSFLEASILLQVINGFLIDYGVSWNIEGPVNGLVALLIVAVVLYGITQSVLGSLPLFVLVIVLFSVLLGQTFIIEWVQDKTGISLELDVILIIVCIAMALVWYVSSYTTNASAAMFLINAAILIFCSAMAIQILSTPATWNSWSQPTYSITFFDYWLAVEAVGVTVVFVCLWRFLRVVKVDKKESDEESSETKKKLKNPVKFWSRLKTPSRKTENDSQNTPLLRTEEENI